MTLDKTAEDLLLHPIAKIEMKREFIIGDQVSIIDENLTGKITGFKKNDLAVVEAEGMEWEFHISKLLLIERAIHLDSNIRSSQEMDTMPFNENVDFEWLPEGSVSMIGSPSIEGKILTGPVNYFIVNRSEVEILFNISVKRPIGFFGLNSGIIKPKEFKILFTKSKEELIEWKHFQIQCLFFQSGFCDLPKPLSVSVPVLIPDLKEKIQNTEGLFRFASVFSIFSFSNTQLNTDKLIHVLKESQLIKAPVIKHQPAILRNDDVIDLHIEKLTDEYKGLGTGQILETQIEKFKAELDYALTNNYQSIVFIHGIGEGKLRQAILNELRFYSGLRFKNASEEKYGIGAIEVILR
ncbi:MAG: Smr/MutS family protein [Bacteroidia bacterium]|nr:Smr/MutS family protein [Bacteroidia bacterium]